MIIGTADTDWIDPMLIGGVGVVITTIMATLLLLVLVALVVLTV
ncbi:MAG: hypothetical protein ABEI76_04720 [Halobacteriales archaeon]